MKTIYRMSEAGICPRVLAAKMLDYEPLPETEASLRILKESSRHEGLVIEDLEEEGYIISDRQKEYTLETPLIILQGHIDGIAHKNGNSHLLEIKAFGRFSFDKFRRQGLSLYPEYQAQITCYAEACMREGTLQTEYPLLPILYVVKCRDTGELSKTFLDSAPLNFQDILDKLHQVEICVQNDTLPDSTFDEKAEKCRWCKHRYLCTEEEKEIRDISNLPTLLEASELFKEGKVYERMAEERIEQARHVFLSHAKENKIDKFRTGGISVSYFGIRQKEYLDEAKLKEIVPEEILRQAYKLGKEWEDIRIRILKEE